MTPNRKPSSLTLDRSLAALAGCMLALAAAVASLAACGTVTTTYGDAALEQGPGFGALRPHLLYLPEFSLDERGLHRYRVAGLPGRAYPYRIDIDTRKSASGFGSPQPWERAVVKVSILEPGGDQVLASKTFDLRGARPLGRGRFENIFWSPGEPPLPFMDEYDVRAEVLRPSFRPGDSANLVLR